ncbi:low-density lipoprotein receptor-related protein 5-like [Babylonia areolata]|uniref:low-density lipoprotein receptor-related protein 5-like n=1 Tax=Babylonia areolata TaxID=304850 RepID=UPI003FD489FA
MGLALCLYPAHIADMSMVNVSLTTQCSVLPPNNYGYLALGFDARRNLLFFSANYTRTISAVRMEAGALPWVVVSGTGVVKGLAVDWVTGALYWTDSSRGHVMVARWDGSFQNVLLQDQVTRPLGIAVHPRRGRIYWTDLGLPSLVKPTLESANMDGSERRVLVSGDALGRPNHVFIDYTKDKLYWADSARNKVMQYDLNSGQWGTFFALPRFKVYGITLYRNYLLWTDMEDMNGIHMARLDIKRRVRSIIHPGYGRAADLITVDRVLQPDMASPCKKSRMLCEQLCLPRGPGNHTCFCGLGFTLEGGMVCIPGKIARDNFLLVTDAHQRNVYQIDVSTGVIRAVTQGERHQPIAVDFLPGAPGMPGTVFWSDNEAHVIRRTRLGGHRWPSTFLDLPEDSKVEGVAVSAEHRLLYFTDVGRHVIGVADLGDHGGSRYRHAVVVSEGLTHPRDIVIYSARGTGVGKIYWTDWGPKATISGAYLSGEHRSVLVSFNRTAWVNGLAVDRIGHSLYWADAYNNEVGVYNLSSGQHRILLSTPAAHFYGLYVMNSFIYLTDWSRRFVLRVPKSGGQLMQFGEGKFNKLFGITGYDSAADRSKQGRGVCADQRRCGLQALCVPRTHLTLTCREEVCVLTRDDVASRHYVFPVPTSP